MQLGRTKVTGRLGMNFVERVALEAHSKPIPVPEDLDTGIDGFIEFSELDGVSRLIAFQIKRGASYFDETGAKCQVDSEHLRFWGQYMIPVFLIVVREDESEAFWMDVREYVRNNPSIANRRSLVLRPPRDHRFDAVALGRAIRYSAQPYGFGDAVSALTDASAGTRLSALSHLYRFKMERRTPLCLSAALRIDEDLSVIGALCDFYSRYLPHPEWSFSADRHLSFYARSLLADFPEAQLLRLLEAFSDDEDCGGWDGSVEIFGMAAEEIWIRQDVIERGSLQQGIAQVILHASTPEHLLSVVANPRVSLNIRRGAVALFGYLGYTCETEYLDGLIVGASDAPLCALLTWLRYWIVEESAEDISNLD